MFRIFLVLALITFLVIVAQDKLPIAKKSTSVQTIAQVASPAQKIDPKRLEKYLTVEAALLGVSSNISYYYKDLNQQIDIGFEPQRSWIPASTVKAFVAVEAYRQKDLGLVDFNQIVTIKADNVVPTELETDDFPRLREGTQVTIDQLVGAMITQSDNTAYNTLLDILDRRNINQTLRNLGLTETVVGEKLNLDDTQYQKDVAVPGHRSNTITAKDYATLFTLLYSHQAKDSDKILEIFKKQKINNMIPLFLPDVSIAHKTGDWAPIYHDGGVIYKPEDPFVFVAFTNSNDPKVVAKLARVAYFKNADAVGTEDITPDNPVPKSTSDTDNHIYTLVDSNGLQVLGATTNEKFPEITAADLGVTAEDVTMGQDEIHKLGIPLIAPNSLLYGAKRWLQDQALKLAGSPGQRSEYLLSQSRSRLAELNGVLERGDIQTAQKLLNDSESELKQSLDQAKHSTSQDELITQIKQTSDLHFAVLAQAAPKIKPKQKEAFIDLVYNYYQKNNTEIKPTIQRSIVADPLAQKPAIGVVTGVSTDAITVSFDDGTTKQVSILPSTSIRNFGDSYLSTNVPKVGDKIGIIGTVSSLSGKIIPRFILNKVPKELPLKHSGTVIEVDPSEKTVTINDQNGKTIEIKVNSASIIRSKDTSVSLSGIKTGSGITFYGMSDSKATKETLPSPAQPHIDAIIKATSITVVKNSPGLKEEVINPSPTRKVEVKSSHDKAKEKKR